MSYSDGRHGKIYTRHRSWSSEQRLCSGFSKRNMCIYRVLLVAILTNRVRAPGTAGNSVSLPPFPKKLIEQEFFNFAHTLFCNNLLYKFVEHADLKGTLIFDLRNVKTLKGLKENAPFPLHHCGVSLARAQRCIFTFDCDIGGESSVAQRGAWTFEKVYFL